MRLSFQNSILLITLMKIQLPCCFSVEIAIIHLTNVNCENSLRFFMCLPNWIQSLATVVENIEEESARFLFTANNISECYVVPSKCFYFRVLTTLGTLQLFKHCHSDSLLCYFIDKYLADRKSLLSNVKVKPITWVPCRAWPADQFLFSKRSRDVVEMCMSWNWSRDDALITMWRELPWNGNRRWSQFSWRWRIVQVFPSTLTIYCIYRVSKPNEWNLRKHGTARGKAGHTGKLFTQSVPSRTIFTMIMAATLLSV